MVPANAQKCCLIVIDGWGVSSPSSSVCGDAIKMAKTPVMTKLLDKYPNTKLEAHGRAVGLPAGLMGNSEVGHLNIGAGRVVFQDIVRIELAIETGEMERNIILINAFEKAKITGRLHLIGLVSDGGVHSHINHLKALLKYAKNAEIPHTFVHAITDGRDTAPTSAIGYLKDLTDYMKEIGYGKLATVIGRYYAMDRDKRWERTKIAFDALTTDSGEHVSLSSLFEEIKGRYSLAEPERDEFLKPMIVEEDGRIKDGDAVIFFNFRSDRMRQIVASFGLGREKLNFTPIKYPQNLSITCMTSYNPEFSFPIISPPQQLNNVLAEWLSKQATSQFHTAETEKYAHVTFFFNGGREVTFPGEDRRMIPSPKVATYDLKPKMSVAEVAESVSDALGSGEYPFVMCNFAPPDMVGHTGKLEPTIRAVEATDAAIGHVFEACEKYGYTLVITSDHGNAEKMLSESGGEHTAHTCASVPLIITNIRCKLQNPPNRSAALCDVAPTILSLMGLPIPSDMTGISIVA
jgi:2,3-bisphosphoglycerate-independent phosphoglycerate mutase